MVTNSWADAHKNWMVRCFRSAILADEKKHFIHLSTTKANYFFHFDFAYSNTVCNKSAAYYFQYFFH